MKKLLLAGLVFLFMSGTAFAIPFQIAGSDLDVTWENGGGLFVDYTPYSMTTPVDLAEGESFDFTFGKVSFPIAWGDGTADLQLDFYTPEPEGSVSGSGTFSVWSLLFISGGDLTFDGPSDFAYSYNGMDGGLLNLSLNSISGFQLGSSVDITGTITNKVAPVPEPGTLLLLGSGLAGLALYRRRSMNK